MNKELASDDFHKKLNYIEHLILINDEYALIGGMYSRLKNIISFNNTSKINYLYCLIKFNNIFMEREDKKNLKKSQKNIENHLLTINTKIFTKIEAVKYLALLNKYDELDKYLFNQDFTESELYDFIDSQICKKYFETNLNKIRDIFYKKNIKLVVNKKLSVI
jgi:hypothetical protein